MRKSLVSQILRNSPLLRFLEIDPGGGQMASFIALIHGLKPAMDVWVKAENWRAFERLASYFGLRYQSDSYIDRHAEAALRGLPRDSFTTTRAALSEKFGRQSEAHIFLALTHDALAAAVGAGWYPLVVDGHMVEKHLADHEKFGEALGYPACCRAFFRKRNNWYSDNTHYAAYKNTVAAPNALSNGLLRHTAFCCTPHMACSFCCRASIAYGGKLREAIAGESRDYAEETDRRLRSPMLCLSELQIYRFNGAKVSFDTIRYDSVEAVNPTTEADLLYKKLARGDVCVIDRNIVRVQRRGSQVDAYAARADKHGPESPFIIECV